MQSSVKRGRFTQQFVDERLKLIEPTLSYDDFGKVDMVVEAVFEGMALKKEVFGQLDRMCRPGRNPGEQHINTQHRRDRVSHFAPRIRHRHAFFQPGECHAPARNRARQGEQQRSDRDLHAAL